MKFFLKTTVFIVFVVSAFKAEAQSVFGERWYRGGFEPVVWSLSISPKGDVVAVLAFHRSDFRARVSFYDVISGRNVKTLEIPPVSSYSHIMWSPGGEFLISSVPGLDKAFIFIDTATGEHFKEIPGSGGAMQYSPDSTYTLAGRNIYSSRDYRFLDTLQHTNNLFSILPGDSLMIFGGSFSKQLTLMRFPSGEILSTFLSPLNQHLLGYTAKRSNPNELVMIGIDSIIVMNITSKKVTLKLPWNGSQGVSRDDKFFLSPDDRYLFVGFSIFDLETYEEIMFQLSSGRRGTLNQLSITPDNSKIIFSKAHQLGTYTCQTNDLPIGTQYVKAVDFSGKLLWRVPAGHDRSVIHASFDNTGEYFSSVSVDSFQITWNSAAGEVLEQKQIQQLRHMIQRGFRRQGDLKLANAIGSRM